MNGHFEGESASSFLRVDKPFNVDGVSDISFENSAA
jgi:hypothetical protein